MSIITAAQYEMERIGFPPDEVTAMTTILEVFFDTWDSGGAVHAMAPVLQKLIAGKPLSPLTGEPDEWVEVGPNMMQNKRLGSVFKNTGEGGFAYDIDGPEGRVPIRFPYSPKSIAVTDPLVVIETGGSS
jgi:hypothetical protein